LHVADGLWQQSYLNERYPYIVTSLTLRLIFCGLYSFFDGLEQGPLPDQVVFFYSFCLLLHTFVLGYTSMSTKPKRGLCEWVSVGFV
jgi:hypothetical protein